MGLWPSRKAAQVGQDAVRVVIVTGSCCIPGMAPLDERARQTVEQAISEAGVAARVTEVPASSAVFGAIPRPALGKLMADFQAGRVGLPLILVNGEPLSNGVPSVDRLKAALLATLPTRTIDAGAEGAPA